MATSFLACLVEPDKWIVSCVKWLNWVVDSEFTRFHMAAESVWICSRVLQELAMLVLMKAFSFYPVLGRKLFSPHPDGHGRSVRAFVCTFSLWWFATREHVEIINFKPCQTHFPHLHGVHHPPVFTLPSETLALHVLKTPDNPVLLSRNQKSPCGFVTAGTRATLLQITKSV